MAFAYIQSIASGFYQSLFSRIIEDPETIDLTDTPGVLSLKTIPKKNINNTIT